MTEKEEEGIPINGELKVIKETFKQLLRNERNDGTIEDLMNDKNSSGARLGAWKILNYLLYKKPEVKLDIILCTQYYRGKPEYSDQGAICKNARTIKDSKTIYACNYFSRVWSLTNTTLQFGNFLLRGKDFIPTTTNRFGRRRSYQRIRKHTASPYASTLRVDQPWIREAQQQLRNRDESPEWKQYSQNIRDRQDKLQHDRLVQAENEAWELIEQGQRRPLYFEPSPISDFVREAQEQLKRRDNLDYEKRK
jgi:hypothetical protein